MNDPDRPRRRYVSPLRTAALEATHGRIIDAATELFSTLGYQATTLAAIAEQAGVSVPRVNLSGTKAHLLVEAYQRTGGAGAEVRPITDEPSFQAIMALPTPEALTSYVAWLADSHERSVRLWFALREASAVDPEAGAAFEAVTTSNELACEAGVAWAAERGLLTGDTPATDRAGSWDLVSSAETYHRYVVRHGWSREQYVAWVRRALDHLVLDLG
ncbi:MAG TPA: helix-turn-helix domain-containing protein [Nocardioides sp.]